MVSEKWLLESGCTRDSTGDSSLFVCVASQLVWNLTGVLVSSHDTTASIRVFLASSRYTHARRSDLQGTQELFYRTLQAQLLTKFIGYLQWHSRL